MKNCSCPFTFEHKLRLKSNIWVIAHLCKQSNLLSRKIIVLFNVSIHTFNVKCFASNFRHLNAVNNKRIYPKVIYKKFTYSPNVFKVIKDLFFPVCLFYFKSFLKMTKAYPVFAHPIFNATVREENFFSPGIISSCCVKPSS